MTKSAFDVIVIGGGPGGYVAAIRASQLGLKVGLIEKAHLGGICLNWGCIPTKALLKSAEVYHTVKKAAAYGVNVSDVSFDLASIVKRSRDVSAQLAGGIKHLMKKNKVTVVEGTAALSEKKGDLHQVSVGSDIYEAKNIVLATGARPRILPGLEADGERVWTYREAMVPTELPSSLLVVGSGAIGIEFASFYHTLGVSVTVVEVQDRILPVEDEEISALAHKAFEKQGIQILTSSQVMKLEKEKSGITVHLKTPKGESAVKVERVITAVGIVANTENLGLEKTKIKIEKGHVATDASCQTHEPGIYAIGDLTSGPWLAHKASHEGMLVAESIAKKGNGHGLDRSLIPGCTYSLPQVASVGITEKQAKEKGYDVSVGRFPFMANGKAIALGETEGLIKTIFDKKTGELLGAHMIGAEVTELIQGYAVAKTLEATEEDLMQVVFPHPTLSEMMHESVLDAFGRAVHF